MRSLLYSALFFGATLVMSCGGDADDATNDGRSGADGATDATGAEVGTFSSATEDVDDDTPQLEDVPDVTGTQDNGEACTGNDECASGWCAPTGLGPICVGTCDPGCPAGFRCVQAMNGGSDPVFVCVPSTTTPVPDGSADSSDAPSDVAQETIDQETIDDVVDVDPGEDGGIISDGDQDDDGIPDDEDNLPCLAIYLVVYNDGVTSGSISLNGAEVVDASSFPTDEAIVVWLNPTTGDNTLALGGKLTGSPSDSMTLEVLDTTGVLYFATVIVREGGSPRDYSFTFTIDATCP